MKIKRMTDKRKYINCHLLLLQLVALLAWERCVALNHKILQSCSKKQQRRKQQWRKHVVAAGGHDGGSNSCIYAAHGWVVRVWAVHAVAACSLCRNGGGYMGEAGCIIRRHSLLPTLPLTWASLPALPLRWDGWEEKPNRASSKKTYCDRGRSWWCLIESVSFPAMHCSFIYARYDCSIMNVTAFLLFAAFV